MTNPLSNPTPVAEVRSVDGVQEVRAVALRTLSQIKELKDQKKLLTEQKKNLMDNDTALTEAELQAEEHLLAIKEAKANVKKKGEYLQLDGKEKQLKEELADLGESLTGHLINYTKLTGSNYIEDESGKELKIKHKVSVKSGQMTLF